ncbi:YlbD family protein [Rossellomorea sp. BNER]|jgi:hypothetical protein|uniref:YlbD family protein n=1 Tax=Rossellomorea sp. BNER TaxID=2962031 RepID=UPI003AF273FC
MANKLHPKVQEFKLFAKNHPKMIKDVRNGLITWQDLFEEWYLLGEDDPRWNEYIEGKNPETKEDKEKNSGDKNWMEQITGVIKNMDAEQMQQHINSISQALGAVQGVLSQFQSGGGGSNTAIKSTTETKPSHPFSFFKD